MENYYDGILFAESDLQHARIIQKVSVTLDDKWIGGSQLKNLDDVKRELAIQVKKAGCNALVKFEYGQRQVSFWRSLLSIDDILWYGSGFAAIVKK
jgi:hypothetical protein